MPAHFEDFEQAGMLMVKFSARSVSGPTFAGDVDEIPNSKVWFTVVLVGLLALVLLSLLKVLAGEFHGVMGAFGELLCFLTRELLPGHR